MRNLNWLFEVAPPFREAVCQAAADWLGSTSLNFAGAWLMEQHKYEHHDSDYEDLRGQHLDDGPCVVPDRFCSDAAKLQISQFVAQETGKTAESDAAKSEIRDFDDSREKLEAFAKRLEEAAKHGDDVTLFGVDYVPDSRYATLREHAAGQAEQLRRLTDECAELRKVAERYKADSVAAQSDADAWRAKCGALLDAAHEMIRIGGDA